MQADSPGSGVFGATTGIVHSGDQAVRRTATSRGISDSGLGDEWARLVDAVDLWKRTGGQVLPDSPRLYEAVDQYLEWLETKSPFRDATKRHWRVRIKTFKKSVTNTRLAQVTPEFIEQFLDKRTSSAACKDTDRRAVSRFFSWCIERPRRWVAANPCREVRIHQDAKGPVAVLSVEECKSLLQAAEANGGELAPVCGRLPVCWLATIRDGAPALGTNQPQ